MMTWRFREIYNDDCLCESLGSTPICNDAVRPQASIGPTCIFRVPSIASNEFGLGSGEVGGCGGVLILLTVSLGNFVRRELCQTRHAACFSSADLVVVSTTAAANPRTKR